MQIQEFMEETADLLLWMDDADNTLQAKDPSPADEDALEDLLDKTKVCVTRARFLPLSRPPSPTHSPTSLTHLSHPLTHSLTHSTYSIHTYTGVEVRIRQQARKQEQRTTNRGTAPVPLDPVSTQHRHGSHATRHCHHALGDSPCGHCHEDTGLRGKVATSVSVPDRVRGVELMGFKHKGIAGEASQ